MWTNQIRDEFVLVEISRVFDPELEVAYRFLYIFNTSLTNRNPDRDWPMFTTDEQQYFEINLQYKDHPSEAVGSRLYAKECHFWMELMPILNQEGCKLEAHSQDKAFKLIVKWSF